MSELTKRLLRYARELDVSTWHDDAELVCDAANEIERLESALWKIANYAEWTRENAVKTGCSIDGMWLVRILEDPNTYRNIAEETLKDTKVRE